MRSVGSTLRAGLPVRLKSGVRLTTLKAATLKMMSFGGRRPRSYLLGPRNVLLEKEKFLQGILKTTVSGRPDKVEL